MIGEEVETPEALEDFPETSDVVIELDNPQEIQEEVCLSALSGNSKGVNSILVAGSVLNRKLSVLVDSGSTHSFIDEKMVHDSGYVVVYSTPMKVTVADGNYVMCYTVCAGFTWKMRGKTFQEYLRIINLGGCDLVMGNDWMKKYNPTKFDHEKRCVTIGKKGNKIVLCVILEEGSLNMINNSSMGKLLGKGHTFMAHLFMIQEHPV